MSNTPDKPAKNPAEIAREAFRLMATRRITPTPEGYREIYNEIAGVAEPTAAETVLTSFAERLSGMPALVALGSKMSQALATRSWNDYNAQLVGLLDLCAVAVSSPVASASPKPIQHTGPATISLDTAPPPSRLMQDLLSRTLSQALASLLQQSPEMAAESDAISRAVKEALTEEAVLAISPRLKQLCFKISTIQQEPVAKSVAGKSTTPVTVTETRQLSALRDLLGRTLTLGMSALLRDTPTLAIESEAIGRAVAASTSMSALSEAETRLKQLFFKIELKSGDMAEQQELLLRLFRLLLENINELVEDDSWLAGQIAIVQNVLSGPITYSALHDATRSLKEVIYKQGVLKPSLIEAKGSVKDLMLTFIDRLSATASSTGNYHEKIGRYSQIVRQARNISELDAILDDVMLETRIAQTEALKSHDAMVSARQAVQQAESRIHELESQLKQMSELVHEDQLTGSLNRRGLDDVFEREMARAERRRTPLCVAMLDLDDFKRLNDVHGHMAGDEVLIHLVKVVKDTLRTMDVIARFGGEEFLIVLPETELDDAMLIITRLQRELTKRIFLYNQEQLLITFSAGVVLRNFEEEQSAMMKRADAALYQAKKAGKNRVVAG